MDVDPHVLPLDADRVPHERLLVGLAGGETGLEVELPTVTGTDDAGSVQAPFVEREAGVGTDVLHGVDPVADPIEPDLDPLHGDPETPNGGNLRESGNTLKFHPYFPRRTGRLE
jgi:hypothetical protein